MKIKNFFSNSEEKQQLERAVEQEFVEEKRKAVSYFLLFGIFSLLSFVLYHAVVSKNFTILAVEVFFLTAVFALYARVFMAKKAQYPPYLSALIMIVSTLFVLFLYFFKSYNNTGLYWIYFFPLIAFYINGKRQGLKYILGLGLLITIVVILNCNKILLTPYHCAELVISFACFIMISFFSFLYENSKEKVIQKITKNLYTDELTGLANRKKLIYDLDKNRDQTSLLLMNIDNFKEVNDFYGHGIGDVVLKDVSGFFCEFLPYIIPYKHHIYKLHADEWAVVIKRAYRDLHKEKLRISEYAGAIYNMIRKKFFLRGAGELSLTLTIGGSCEDENHMEFADMSLKYAKLNKLPFYIWNDSLNLIKNLGKNLKWTRILSVAMKNDMILPYYQPIVDLHNGRVYKYECLVRLIDENQRVISPFFFLKVAKQTKHYKTITKRVVEKSIKMFHANDLSFTVNLSVEDILDPTTVKFLEKSVLDAKISNRVIFELTETEEMGAPEEVSKFIKRFKKLGCRIAIDDFGSGYSNWDYVLRLDADYIKIDSSLIKDIDRDEIKQRIVESIVRLCAGLKKKTIAEFVCNKEVYQAVKKAGVDFAQGYFIGKPVKFIGENSYLYQN